MYRDVRQVEGDCSVADLESMLQLLALIFREQQLRESAWNQVRTKLQEKCRHQENSPMFQFQSRLSAITTSDHPFFRPLTLDGIARMSFSRIKRIFHDCFRSLFPFVFVLTGSLPDLQSITIPMLSKYFGHRLRVSGDFDVGSLVRGRMDATEGRDIDSRLISEHPQVADDEDKQPSAILDGPVLQVVPKFPEGRVTETIYCGIAPKAMVAFVFPIEYNDHESLECVFTCQVRAVYIFLFSKSIFSFRPVQVRMLWLATHLNTIRFSGGAKRLAE